MNRALLNVKWVCTLFSSASLIPFPSVDLSECKKAADDFLGSNLLKFALRSTLDIDKADAKGYFYAKFIAL
jgi:hypothetical protein